MDRQNTMVRWIWLDKMCAETILISIRLFNLSRRTMANECNIYSSRLVRFCSSGSISGSPFVSLGRRGEWKSIRSHSALRSRNLLLGIYNTYKCGTFWGFMHCLIRQFMAAAKHIRGTDHDEPIKSSRSNPVNFISVSLKSTQTMSYLSWLHF